MRVPGATVILYCNYEELAALKAGARVVLEREPPAGGPVLAPPETRAHVEALLPRLEGDLSVSTLAELRVVQDRKSTRLNSSHSQQSRMPSSA